MNPSSFIDGMIALIEQEAFSKYRVDFVIKTLAIL